MYTWHMAHGSTHGHVAVLALWPCKPNPHYVTGRLMEASDLSLGLMLQPLITQSLGMGKDGGRPMGPMGGG